MAANTFTERLQDYMRRSGIPQAELARRAKCDVTTIARLRACEPNRLPPWSLVLAVMWACRGNSSDVQMAELLNTVEKEYDAALLQFPRRKTAETRAMPTDATLKAVHTEDLEPKVSARRPFVLDSWAKK